jgi:multidrug efflux pump subunit AcrB
MGFLALMILGLALTPLLKVKLLPDRSLPSISVYYSYGGANAVVADSEVTSRLEAVFSRLERLVKLRSRTGDGNGAITMERAEQVLFKKTVFRKFAPFYTPLKIYRHTVSSLCLYHNPEGFLFNG